MKLKSLSLSGALPFLVLTAPGAAIAGPTDPITLAFGETTVTASGVSPGAEVLLYTLARIPSGGVTTVFDETYRLSDADSDDEVLLELGEEVPWRSLWVAFDLTTGAYAVDQASIGVREVDFAERGSRSGATLEYRRPRRPGPRCHHRPAPHGVRGSSPGELRSCGSRAKPCWPAPPPS